MDTNAATMGAPSRRVGFRDDGHFGPAVELSASVSDPGDDVPALVAAARVGDRRAFGALYRRYARMVHGVLLARVPRDVADDLTQDVFVSVMARLDSLRDPRVFGAWIATIARNRANDWRRRKRDTVELDEDFAAADTTPSDEDRASARAALAAIRALPEAYRETLVLRLVEGLSGPEIAERTGLSPGSVRVNLHRGMQKLRERLNEGDDRAG